MSQLSRRSGSGSWPILIRLIRAAIRRAVAEFGHGPHCACHEDGDAPQSTECEQAGQDYGEHHHPFTDDRCLPRGEKPSFWAIEWRSRTKLEGFRTHLQWTVDLRLFRSRQEARNFINQRYGYIRDRADLRAEPHGWRIPRAVRVRVLKDKP